MDKFLGFLEEMNNRIEKLEEELKTLKEQNNGSVVVNKIKKELDKKAK